MQFPNYDMKTILGNFRTKVGKDFISYPACGEHILHNEQIIMENEWGI